MAFGSACEPMPARIAFGANDDATVVLSATRIPSNNWMITALIAASSSF